MLIAFIVLVYLIIAFLSYKYIVSKWNHETWEKIMISLSWICVIPLWFIYKINKIFSK